MRTVSVIQAVLGASLLAGSLSAQDEPSNDSKDYPPITDYTVGVAYPVHSNTYDIQPQIQVLTSDPYARLVPFHRTPLPEDQRPEGREDFWPTSNKSPIEKYGGFEGIDQTPWAPPDPSLAVGPDHVLQVVNMSIAWWDKKTSTLQFTSRLDNTGSPGFFEDVGAGGFTFDPKCLYDEHSGRFFVLALEVYTSSGEAWITFAVSDDSDPNGVWYKYRTDAVTTVGGHTKWVDYPGLGVTVDAFVVTGNLFGLSGGGFAGTKYRILRKSDLLTGGPVTFFDLRDGNSASTQVAHIHSTGPDPVCVSVEDSNEIRVQSISNPLSSPALITTTVSVDSFSSPPNVPTLGSDTIDALDGRIMNAYIRAKRLYTCHGVDNSGDGEAKAVARWYEMKLNDWPNSGSVTLEQQGNVNLGTGIATWFPAIAQGSDKDIGMVFARGAADEYPSIWYARHEDGFPPNNMSAPIELKAGVSGYSNGRWGDYFDIAVDPLNDNTFWGVGEFAETTSSWSTWIGPLGFEQGSISYIEPGCAGSGGLIPLLDVTGSTIGGPLQLDISNSLGGVPYYLVASGNQVTGQVKGCDVYVGFPWLLLGPAIMGGPGIPGLGNSQLNLTIPCNPLLTGVTLYLQVLVLDPGGILGLSATRAAAVTVGDRD